MTIDAQIAKARTLSKELAGVLAVKPETDNLADLRRHAALHDCVIVSRVFWESAADDARQVAELTRELNRNAQASKASA